jgi:hypothetical protein
MLVEGGFHVMVVDACATVKFMLFDEPANDTLPP